MKINRSSWHYKFLNNNKYECEMPKTLCSYVPILIFNLLILLFMACSAVFMLGYSFYFHWGKMIVAGLILTLLLIVGRWIVDNRAQKPKSPSVFVEYIKAKKRKICPLIEYTDE